MIASPPTTYRLKKEWLEPNFIPDTLYQAPFDGMIAKPRFENVLTSVTDDTPSNSTLEQFAEKLVWVVTTQLKVIQGPIHCLLSGGYDSRILATIFEHVLQRDDVLYVTDGEETPQSTDTLDFLGVPPERRYKHDMKQADPYGLTTAVCDGFAPLYSQFSFTPKDKEGVTLVSGLGGGEWFSYPASGWHNGKKHRIPHNNLVSMWMDCWPQYSLLPDAWGRGYKSHVMPYCTAVYGKVANHARPEWVKESDFSPELDLVRMAMLDHLNPHLKKLGWVPHVYDWHLTDKERDQINMTYLTSPLGFTYHKNSWGMPGDMDAADFACTMAGLATWIDLLEQPKVASSLTRGPETVAGHVVMYP